MVFPLILERGRLLFKEGIDEKVLSLLDTKTFRSGIVVLTSSPKSTRKEIQLFEQFGLTRGFMGSCLAFQCPMNDFIA